MKLEPQNIIEGYDIVTWTDLKPGDEIRFCAIADRLPGFNNERGTVKELDPGAKHPFITIYTREEKRERFNIHEINRKYWWRENK